MKSFHGILLNVSFKDGAFLEELEKFAVKRFEGNTWVVYGVKIPEEKIDLVVGQVQGEMREGKYFNHFYEGNDLVIVYKDKVFKVKTDKRTWKKALEHGKKLGISEEQLDFEPYSVEGEKAYFGK